MTVPLNNNFDSLKYFSPKAVQPLQILEESKKRQISESKKSQKL